MLQQQLVIGAFPMRLVLFVIYLQVVTLGCTSNDAVPVPPQGAGQTESSRAQDALVGTYIRGDGLGFDSFVLNLTADRRFTSHLSGCLGDYGTTSGTWSLDHNRITVIAVESTDRFELEPLGSLTIIDCDGEKRLLRDADADRLKNPEMLRFFSFGRVEAE